jgi:hypothetical protein
VVAIESSAVCSTHGTEFRGSALPLLMQTGAMAADPVLSSEAEQSFGSRRVCEHGLKMAESRIFTIGRDGRFISFRKFSCVDDADAAVWAKQLIDLYPVEFWCGDLLMTRLDPAAAIPATSCSASSVARAEPSPEPGSC